MTITYVDTNVLMAAARGTRDISAQALQLLADPNRQFVSSVFSMLESIPVPKYNGYADEVEFYETFYDGCAQVVEATEALCREGFEEAVKHGMGAVDALHVVAASFIGADELVTNEGEDRSIHRTDLVNVVKIV